MTLVSWCSRCQENDFKIQMALSLSRNQDPLTRDNPPCCEQFHVGTIFFPCRRKWAFRLLLELIKLTKQTNITAQPRRMTLMFTSRTVTSEVPPPSVQWFCGNKIVPTWNCLQQCVWIILSNQLIISRERHPCCNFQIYYFEDHKPSAI